MGKRNWGNVEMKGKEIVEKEEKVTKKGLEERWEKEERNWGNAIENEVEDEGQNVVEMKIEKKGLLKEVVE